MFGLLITYKGEKNMQLWSLNASLSPSKLKLTVRSGILNERKRNEASEILNAILVLKVQSILQEACITNMRRTQTL
jgi:hypothetical protein